MPETRTYIVFLSELNDERATFGGPDDWGLYIPAKDWYATGRPTTIEFSVGTYAKASA